VKASTGNSGTAAQQTTNRPQETRRQHCATSSLPNQQPQQPTLSRSITRRLISQSTTLSSHYQLSVQVTTHCVSYHHLIHFLLIIFYPTSVFAILLLYFRLPFKRMFCMHVLSYGIVNKECMNTRPESPA